jgi:hypothetical protein
LLEATISLGAGEYAKDIKSNRETVFCHIKAWGKSIHTLIGRAAKRNPIARPKIESISLLSKRAHKQGDPRSFFKFNTPYKFPENGAQRRECIKTDRAIIFTWNGSPPMRAEARVLRPASSANQPFFILYGARISSECELARISRDKAN